MSKTLLALGIGHSQLDLITIAKDMGFRVYACAHDPKGVGFSLVDGFKTIDIKDSDAIAEYAQQINADAVYSMGLEPAIEPIAIVSHKLGLPCFYNLKMLSKIADKATWREALGSIEGNVKYQKGNNITDFIDWNTYPAIIKPVDSTGQRGIYRINNYDDLVSFFPKVLEHSVSKTVIVEQYIEGSEISVNSFMEDGRLKFAMISDRISYDNYPGGIIKEHHVPSRVVGQQLEKSVLDLVETVNQIIGFTDGHIYFQLKLQDNKPYLIEFTPRFDGCHMWRLIKEATGLDLRRVTLEKLMFNQSQTLKDFELRATKDVITVFISAEPGTVVDKASFDLPGDLLYLEWYYSDGDIVKRVTGYLEKVGYFIKEG
jgi:biotin carboxylase